MGCPRDNAFSVRWRTSTLVWDTIIRIYDDEFDVQYYCTFPIKYEYGTCTCEYSYSYEYSYLKALACGPANCCWLTIGFFCLLGIYKNVGLELATCRGKGIRRHQPERQRGFAFS